MSQILLIEDNKDLAENIKQGLEEADHEVCWTATAGAGLKACGPETELVLLDLGLPDQDGLDLMDDLRDRYPSLAILVLTARGEIGQRVQGLDRGADDYLTKPFAFSELTARVRALLRRNPGKSDQRLGREGLTLDERHRQLVGKEVRADLAPREYDLLAFLLANTGVVLSRDMIAREVWQFKSVTVTRDNIIDVHVSRVRNKLSECGCDDLIHTVRGVGFTIHENH